MSNQDTLSPKEVATFNHSVKFLAHAIAQQAKLTLAIGQILDNIQGRKLYRGQYRDFRDFLATELDLQKDSGYRYINCYRTLLKISTYAKSDINPAKYSSICRQWRHFCDTELLSQYFQPEEVATLAAEFPETEIPIPQSIRQYQELNKSVEPEQIGPAWIFVLDKALETKSKITVDFIKKTLAEFKGEKPALDLDQKIDMAGIPPLKAYKSHFVQFPNDLFDHGLIRILGPNTIAVYQVIIRIGASNINKGNPHCECSHEQIEELTGLGHTTISKSVALLEKVGLVMVERGVKQRNKYQLLDPTSVIERHKWERVFGISATPIEAEAQPKTPKPKPKHNNAKPEDTAATSEEMANNMLAQLREQIKVVESELPRPLEMSDIPEPSEAEKAETAKLKAEMKEKLEAYLAAKNNGTTQQVGGQS